LTSRHPSSYRDPSGFIFTHEGVLYRQINKCFAKNFEIFINSGLHDHLIKEEMLIADSIINENLTGSGDWHLTLKPQLIPFISYSYEWSFDMLKDAALLTLKLAKEAMKFGMLLKDATPLNIQFYKGKPIFIDSLSFEAYDETKPWIAYRQFCETFLAPLALMHYLQTPLQPMLLAYPDGIPLSVAAKLLPWKSKLNLNVNLHVHLQTKIAAKADNTNKSSKEFKFSASKLKNILSSLESSIQYFQLNASSGSWSGYYNEAEQREDYLDEKKAIISQWLSSLQLKTAIDVGANEGFFSKLLNDQNIEVLSADSDHFSINNLYKQIKKEDIENIMPLIIDFANPSPAIGVNNTERNPFLERVNVDLVIALAVIHHLAIGRNIPFAYIATLFKKFGPYLIIEFVPKEDEKIQLMLQHKKDIYNWYTEENFLKEFAAFYHVAASEVIGQSKRKLFLMQANEQAF